MSQLEVFWGSGSQPSWRVLLTLAIKNVPYESKLLSFSTGDHKKPEFLALNPRHKVPVIRQGDFVLYESVAIMAYLDKKYPDPPLFGTTPEETGIIWRWVAEFQCYLEPATHERIVRPLFFNRWEEQADSMREAIPVLHAELGKWEHALAERSWLVGDQITAADIAVFPTFMALLRAAGKPAAQHFDLGVQALAEQYPALHRWADRIAALPGYDATYPPHWRE